MESNKLWFVSMLVIVCIAGGYFVYTQGADSGAYKYAADSLKAETNKILNDNKDLEKQRTQYMQSIDENTAELAENENESKELKSYYDQINDYEQKSQQLDSDIQAAQTEKESLSEYASAMGAVSNDASGESRALAAGTYQCPADIAAGRYKLTGTGSFRVVINASNRVSESQNLSSLDGNSYTMNLEAETKLITEGDVTITPVR